jgi:NAD(P)H-hydrate epimerase
LWRSLIDRVITAPYHPSVLPVISAKQMREIDRLTIEDNGIPSLQLMQAAAKACFQEIGKKYSGKLAGKKARILSGPGNNGGDGAALAILLCNAGVATELILFGRVEETHGDARVNFERIRKLSRDKTRSDKLSFIECEGTEAWKTLFASGVAHDIIVDALFGTGLNRPLSGLFAGVVNDLAAIRCNRENSLSTGPLIFSIDVPSGLNSDNSEPIGAAVHADLTVTFTAPKTANVLPPASHLNGRLAVADIGSPVVLIERVASNLFLTAEDEARQWLIATRYTPESFKNTHGHVLVIAGSRGYTGAAVLCANAAMSSGAGLTTIATPASAQSTIAATAMPEVITRALAETDRGVVADTAVDYALQLASKATVIAIGPGLTADDERTRSFVHSVVARRKTPMVIDADGLNCLAPWPSDLKGTAETPLILTPHPGEMLRLMGTADKSVLYDPVTTARDFATRNQLILVLKGSRSLIAAPDGRVFINPTGNPGLGTAGAGDTLTGLIASFVAQEFAQSAHKADCLTATIAALYVGGLAGDLAAQDIGMRSMVASDIRAHIGEAIRSLDPTGEQFFR